MHLFYIPQCNIQNRNVHISVLNGAMWDTEQMHCGICEIGLFQYEFQWPDLIGFQSSSSSDCHQSNISYYIITR